MSYHKWKVEPSLAQHAGQENIAKSTLLIEERSSLCGMQSYVQSTHHELPETRPIKPVSSDFLISVLQVDREVARLSLIIPSFYPSARAK